MKKTLNRDVRVYGVVYPVGTDLADLPQDAQISVRDSGWTSDVEESVVKSTNIKPETTAKTDTKPDIKPDIKPDAKLDANSNSGNETTDNSTSTDSNTKIDDRLLSGAGLDPEHLAMLTAAGLVTYQDAINHLDANQSFRTVPGVTKQVNSAIIAKLGV